MENVRNSYQKSVKVLKNNIARVIAVTLFFCSFFVFFIMLQQFFEEVFHWDLSIRNPAGLFLMLFLFLVICVMLLLPLEMGTRRWFYGICFEEQQPLTTLFYYFQQSGYYLKVIRLRLYILFLQLAVYFISLLPAILFQLILSVYPEAGGLWSQFVGGLLLLLRGVSFICGGLCGFYYNLRYFLVPFLFFRHPEKPVRELVKMSKIEMKKKSRDLLNVYLSMFPFCLLAIWVLPLIMLMPYFYVVTSIEGIAFLNSLEKQD